MIHNLKAKPAQSDVYFMPRPLLEEGDLGEEIRERAIGISVSSIREKVRLVGPLLEESPRTEYPPGPRPNVVFLLTQSRMLDNASPDRWRHWYDRTLKAIRQTMPKGVIWIKTHPRTPPDQRVFLTTLASRYQAELWGSNHLIQCFFEKWGTKRVAVVGLPSSPLLDVCMLGYGAAFCPNFGLAAHYFGDAIRKHFYYQEDYACMKACGVRRFSDQEVLKKRLARFLKGNEDY